MDARHGHRDSCRAAIRRHVDGDTRRATGMRPPAASVIPLMEHQHAPLIGIEVEFDPPGAVVRTADDELAPAHPHRFDRGLVGRRQQAKQGLRHKRRAAAGAGGDQHAIRRERCQVFAASRGQRTRQQAGHKAGHRSRRPPEAPPQDAAQRHGETSPPRGPGHRREWRFEPERCHRQAGQDGQRQRRTPADQGPERRGGSEGRHDRHRRHEPATDDDHARGPTRPDGSEIHHAKPGDERRFAGGGRPHDGGLEEPLDPAIRVAGRPAGGDDREFRGHHQPKHAVEHRRVDGAGDVVEPPHAKHAIP